MTYEEWSPFDEWIESSRYLLYLDLWDFYDPNIDLVMLEIAVFLDLLLWLWTEEPVKWLAPSSI